MKNIHILPTDEQIKNVGDLVKDKYGDIHIFTKNDGKEYGKTTTKLNIYITYDEEIKEGDWVYRPTDKIVLKCTKNMLISVEHLGLVWNKENKKIILTTDVDLIKDGVQSIDDEFLEWFVKNQSCEKVEVEYGDDGNGYQIIIPKEEPKKVLTEEDIFNQKDIDAVTDYINKEQQKQALIEMMEKDEELGLYDDIKANRIELVCKDCSDSLENCTCIVSTIDFPKEELSTKLHIGEVVDESYPESFKKQETLEEEPNIIDQWLEKNGTSEISKQVEEEAEESCKQETLEEVAKSHAIYELENNYKPTKESFKLACKRNFIRGAKWQQKQDESMVQGYLSANLKNMELLKRSYSEEEFKLFARQYYREIKLDKSNLLWDELADKCFEQFKKK